MSRKYKFHNKEGLYCVSFATVYWLDIFVRDQYFSLVSNSLPSARRRKAWRFCWCLMPSHIHLIFRAKNNNPSSLLGILKTETSKKLQKIIKENIEESRKEWLMWMFERAGRKISNIKGGQLWQRNNKPIELWSSAVIEQKVDYIHNNPVEAGFVLEPHYWKYSSAIDYSGGKGVIEIDLL